MNGGVDITKWEFQEEKFAIEVTKIIGKTLFTNLTGGRGERKQNSVSSNATGKLDLGDGTPISLDGWFDFLFGLREGESVESVAEKVVKNQETLKRIQKAFNIVEANEKVTDSKEGIDEYLNTELDKENEGRLPLLKQTSKSSDICSVCNTHEDSSHINTTVRAINEDLKKELRKKSKTNDSNNTRR